MIPIPKWASKSIETSLAPSPIERVIFDWVFFLIIQTISAFSEGETQHAITVSHVFASWMKISYVYFIPLKATDSIIKALFTCYFHKLSFSFRIFGVKNSKAYFSVWISQICMVGHKREQENPMFFAVSSLSPVSIQTFIWASQND